jgi:uncharacterized membrane protein YkgB
MHPRIDGFDRSLSHWMRAYGHRAHRYGLASLFIWFGTLKTLGHETTTTLLAQTVYLGDPERVVPLLGWWEVAIGLALFIRSFNRLALFLLMLRLPGTMIAFFALPEVCFAGSVLVPTPEGQYLIKDMVLFTSALIIGGTLRKSQPDRVFH